MSHKHTFEAVNKSLRDIMKEVSPELADVFFWRQGFCAWL